MIKTIRSSQSVEEVRKSCGNVKSKVTEVWDLIDRMMRALKGGSVEMLGDLLEGELSAMEKAIEEAAKRIEVRIKSCLSQQQLHLSHFNF